MRTLQARTEIYVDPDGIPIQMIGIGLDINKRARTEAEMVSLLDELRLTEKKLRVQNEVCKNAQEQLLQERQRYQDLFEFAPDGYLVTDANGVILEANQAVAGLFDIRQDLLTSKPLVTFISPEKRQTFQTMLLQVKNSEKVRGWESTIGDRILETRYSPLRDSKDEVAGVIGVSIDITVQKLLEPI